MGSKDLEGLLTRKHQHRKANEADWEAAKSDWLASVDAFYDAFCGNYRTKKMMITAWDLFGNREVHSSAVSVCIG